MKFSEVIPWDDLAEAYYQSLPDAEGRPAKDAQLVICAVIIKHKLKLMDEETRPPDTRKPYLQYLAALKDFNTNNRFPLLFSSRYEALRSVCFETLHQVINNQLAGSKSRQAKKQKGILHFPVNTSQI